MVKIDIFDIDLAIAGNALRFTKNTRGNWPTSLITDTLGTPRFVFFKRWVN